MFTQVVRLLDRNRVIESLANLRQEWQITANGLPLDEVKASVGFLLADVCAALELQPFEAEWVLGFEVFTEPLPTVVSDPAE